jgi:glycosyltransferase involved in cell wall biosynthesis
VVSGFCCAADAHSNATFFMTRPKVSVVVETITAREGITDDPLVERVSAALDGVARQTYPKESLEQILVIDGEIDEPDVQELRRRYPAVNIVWSPVSNYLAAKNAGAAVAAGDVIAFLDSDCAPSPGWLEALVDRFAPGVAAVGGRSRYTDNLLAARTFSIPDFSYALAEEGGVASGFNIHNVAFRREVLLSHPFEERIRRDGGCYLLFHQLRAEGATILHEPRATVEHGFDMRGLGFVHKHFKRGFDGAMVYSLDDRAVLKGTMLVRRFGAAALVPITGRRIVVDWLRLIRHRRQIGIPTLTLPYFMAVGAMTRLIELTGGLATLLPKHSRPPET